MIIIQTILRIPLRECQFFVCRGFLSYLGLYGCSGLFGLDCLWLRWFVRLLDGVFVLDSERKIEELREKAQPSNVLP
jgi:hypothetical protein